MKNLKEDNFDHYHILVFAGNLSFFFFSFPITFWLNDYSNFCSFNVLRKSSSSSRKLPLQIFVSLQFNYELFDFSFAKIKHGHFYRPPLKLFFHSPDTAFRQEYS